MNRTVLKTLSYIGAAIKEGQPHKGVERGADLVRHSGVFQTLKNIHKLPNIKDYGNISIQSLTQEERRRPPIKHMVNDLNILDPLLGALNQKLKQVHRQRQEGNVVLTIGGDHSVGSASIEAALSVNKNLKVIWVDAHADFVNPYLKGTQSQNYHGMPLSHVSGVMKLPGFQWMKSRLPFQNMVLIAIRDLDQDQYTSLLKHKVKVFTMEHVVKYGIGEVMTRTLKYLDPQGNSPFHISFDLDAVDPYIVNQTGTVYRNGLDHRQSCHIIRRVVNQKKLVSMDVVQINPEKGVHQVRPKFRDQQYYSDQLSESVGLAADLITSLCNRTLIFQ